MAPTTPKHFQRPGLIFIPWCGQPDWYESMSRTPTRDEWFPPRVLVSSCRRPSESPRTRHSRESNPEGEGSNHTKHLHQSTPRFSYLGVPAPADMSDWYESMSRTPTRDEWFPPRVLVSSCRRPSESPRTRHSRESGNPGVGYGLQMSRKHLHQSTPRFSYLGVPAADMSDWCESMSRTPTRDGFRHRPATPTTVARTTTAEGRKRDVALGLGPLPAGSRPAGHCHYGPHFVIPAKAGIQGRNRRPPPIFIPQCAGGNRRGRFLWNLAPPRLATD